MAEAEHRSFGKELNAWVQTIGIVIAAAWGVYTFVYTEIVMPRAAPVNITVDLGLKKVGGDKPAVKNPAKQLIPVEMRISAKNPSTREVYLLPSAWIAYGIRIEATGDKPPDEFQKPAALTAETGASNVERCASVSSGDIVAFGGLLPDTELKPNEVSTRTLIFYVPPNEYDSLDVRAYVPTVAKENAVSLEWNLEQKQNTITATMYRLDASGDRQEMKRDKDGSYSDEKIGLQQATSMAELSLWQ